LVFPGPGGLRVHAIEQVLNSLPADLPVWAVAVVGILLAAFLLVRGKKSQPRAKPAPVVSQPTPANHSENTADVALQELAEARDVQSLQSRAAQQIDAAEHALNRLLADCAGIADLPIEPTLRPERQLKTEVPAPAAASLAA
jgi:hypothetical protein